MNKLEIVETLNSLEIIESSGGDCAYALVENNEENRQTLNDVGISTETINSYGDDETFCILALGFGEGLVDLWDGDKLVVFEDKVEIPVSKEQGKDVVLYKEDDKVKVAIYEDGGDVYIKELTNEQIEGIKKFIA